MRAPPKRKTAARRIRSSGQQHRATKRSVVAGNRITLPAKVKRTLARISTLLSDAFDCTDQAANNIRDGEAWELYLSVRGLPALLANLGRLRNAARTVRTHAKRRTA